MNISLTTPVACAVGFALLAGAAGHALAQDQDSSAPKTRAQVQAELLEAQRTGDIIALGNNSGKRLNELYPDRYPAKPAVQGLTREQVKAELLEAQRTGDIIALGNNSGKRLNELYPDRYPAANRAR